MSTDPETAARLHFACTTCGKCCDRSPEVLLSEAADLADTFVFRLMFRLYVLPSSYSARSGRSGGASGSAASFYESKRLLTASSCVRLKRSSRSRITTAVDACWAGVAGAPRVEGAAPDVCPAGRVGCCASAAGTWRKTKRNSAEATVLTADLPGVVSGEQAKNRVGYISSEA